MSARIVNVRPKPGYIMDHGGNVVRMQTRDGLANLITGLGTRADARSGRFYFAQHLGPQQIEEAYEASAMLRKAITIPATERIRAWRDWQADDDQIEALEAEEQRHQMIAKVKQCEILRGLGGGALILVGPGDPAMPINVTGKGGLVAVNVVSRWHLEGQDWIDDLASPDYGQPTYWLINGQRGQTRLHPSRVVCFRAEPLPSVWNGDWAERFWGRGRVTSLLEPAQNLDEALATFSAIIKDALTIDVGVSRLLELVATDDGEKRLMRRLSLMIQGSSILNGKVYDLGDAEGKGGEKIDRHQVTWAGIPEIVRVYAEALSAASDIPVTRLWGTSAKGLNATGEGDDTNWTKMVETGRELETRPCLEQVDAALIPSALGARPPEIWWKFAALDVPDEKEETDRFKTWTEAMDRVALSGAVPEAAFNETYQNGLRENGWAPGIDAALDKIPEDERFGGAPDDTDPSALRAENEPAPRVANDSRFLADAEPRTLYVSRKVVNAAEIIRWAKGQGLEATLPAEDMHVTIAFSRNPVDWFAVGSDWSGDENGNLRIKPGGPRTVERLGDGDAVALLFQNDDLRWRHERIIEAGASWDWPEYRPHITLSWQAEGVDVGALEPYTGPIVLGPELFAEVREDWKETITETA